MYSSTILDLGTGWRWVVSFMPWLLWPQYPLDRRLGGPQSGCCGAEKKISCPSWESNPSHPDHSPSLYSLSYPALTYILFIVQKDDTETTVLTHWWWWHYLESNYLCDQIFNLKYLNLAGSFQCKSLTQHFIKIYYSNFEDETCRQTVLSHSLYANIQKVAKVQNI
jgi:hypothetical protein